MGKQVIHAGGDMRGQAAVEFAMGVLVLLLVVMALFDFGRGIAAYSAMSHGAMEGARIALYAASSDAAVRDAVRAQTVILPDLADGEISITPSGARSIGDSVKVQIDYRYQTVTPIIGRFLPSGGVQLRAAATSIVQ